MIRTSHTLGENLVVCDVCGCKYLSSEIRETWDGYLVCNRDWYPKHPQLDIKAIRDSAPVTYHRNPTDTFATPLTGRYVEVNYWLSGYAVGD